MENIWIFSIKYLLLFAPKYKPKFIDADQACKVDLNWMSPCIFQCKTREQLLFDLLTCYLFIFLLFLLWRDVVPWQSDTIHSVHPPFCWGWGLNLLPKFQKRGGGGACLTGPQFLEGVAWKERVAFFRGVAIFR